MVHILVGMVHKDRIWVGMVHMVHISVDRT